MNISRQDAFVLLFYYLGYSKMRNLVLGIQGKAVAMFVTFHDILPESVANFKNNLHFLRHRMNVISLDDFFLGKLSARKINVAITFDDGYKSWVSEALPILRELELPATFFVSSGFVGLSAQQEKEFASSNLFKKMGNRRITGCLNPEDIARLADEGFIIGGHTVSHCNLSEVHDYGQLEDEIFQDKVKLEGMTGRKIEYFAYPSGAYQNSKINVIEVLRKDGYKGAVTTLSGFNDLSSNPYLLKRGLTRASMAAPVFKARVLGNYDAIHVLKRAPWLALVRRYLSHSI